MVTSCSGGSAVANPVRRAFPLRNIVGDHARRFHGGLAELRIAGDLTLDPLTFGMEEVAQAFEFGNQVLDFRDRSPGDALDQNVRRDRSWDTTPSSGTCPSVPMVPTKMRCNLRDFPGAVGEVGHGIGTS